MMLPSLEIRNDDVLQTTETTTAHQRADLDGRTLFEAFLEADDLFKKYEYPCTLAICADGLFGNKEWVAHLKAHKERYRFELHCFEHKNHKDIPITELEAELLTAKGMIRRYLDTEVTMWYPPFGRKGTPEWGDKVCENIGIKMYHQIGKVDAKLWLKNPDKYPHINFHFWNRSQVEHIKEILKRIHESN